MKFRLLLLILSAFLLTSCFPTMYYQVYQTESDGTIQQENDRLVYEDEHCLVSYDLWSDGGNMGFRFYNKTDRNIAVNLTQSFFVFNGIAHDYYRNKIFTPTPSLLTTTRVSGPSTTGLFGLSAQPKTQGDVTTASPTPESTVSYKQNRIVIIPPKTAKIIVEYDINNSLYRDCDLYKYPNKNQITPKTFSKADSPFVFSNRIAYSLGDSSQLVRFENEFYISKITNYPEKAIVDDENEAFCDQKMPATHVNVFKKSGPDEFYIKYTKTDNWKH